MSTPFKKNNRLKMISSKRIVMLLTVLFYLLAAVLQSINTDTDTNINIGPLIGDICIACPVYIEPDRE